MQYDDGDTQGALIEERLRYYRQRAEQVEWERDEARAMAREVADVIESLQIETDMYRAVRLAACIERLRGEAHDGQPDNWRIRAEAAESELWYAKHTIVDLRNQLKAQLNSTKGPQ